MHQSDWSQFWDWVEFLPFQSFSQVQVDFGIRRKCGHRFSIAHFQGLVSLLSARWKLEKLSSHRFHSLAYKLVMHTCCDSLPIVAFSTSLDVLSLELESWRESSFSITRLRWHHQRRTGGRGCHLRCKTATPACHCCRGKSFQTLRVIASDLLEILWLFIKKLPAYYIRRSII